jgi:hypothetical protein
VIYDVGEEGGDMFIAMELVRGRPLRAMVGDSTIPASRKLRWLIEAARALGAAHRAGLIHRDIKPDNIMIREDGMAKVLDFGIARREAPRGISGSSEERAAHDASTITAEGAIVGTPRYWAPEQLRADPIDARVDQFAWAVTAYELLAGRAPWPATEPVALLSQILTSDPPPLSERAPDVPEQAARAIERALSKRPDDRFPTIDDAADALEPFAEVTTPLARAAPPSQRGVSDAATGPRSAPSDATGMTRETGQPRRAPQSAHESRSRTRTLALFAALAIVAIMIGVGAGILRSQPPQAAAQAEPSAPLTVAALTCREAKLEGSGALPELARAIGVGACARLAVEVGVDWSASGPGVPINVVNVETKLEGGGAEIRLSVGDRSASARGSTPLEAMSAAAATLAKKLAPPTMSQAEITAWGAKDEVSARHIYRTLRRIELDFTVDDNAAARELLESDPGSAIAHHIADLADLGGAEESSEWARQAADRAASLPPGRAKVLRAIAAIKKREYSESLRLLRQAYAESPDDTWVAQWYGHLAVHLGASEEGFAVLERLHARAPSRSIWALYHTFNVAPLRDADRERKYIAELQAILPESAAWVGCVRNAVLANNLDEARTRIALGLNLGTTGASGGSFYAEKARAWAELATFEPKAAREIATKLLGEPRGAFAQKGADILIASYILEGRMDDATAAQVRELERYKDDAGEIRALDYAALDIRQRRLLGRPPPSAERLDWIQKRIDGIEGSARGKAVGYRAELAIAQAAASPKQARAIAERALAEIEAYIRKDATGDRDQEDSHLIKTVPLLRVARGDAAAAKRWIECDRARYHARNFAALDAALALEATGDLKGAEKAYQEAQDPTTIESWTLQIVVARVKLAELYRSQKRDDEAAKLDVALDRLWTSADPGFRETLKKIQ